MNHKRQIYFVIYNGFELLDMSGPASVFTTVNVVTGRDLYSCEVLSIDGGLVASGSGLSIHSEPLKAVQISANDTVLVMGSNAEFLRPAAINLNLLAWLNDNTQKAERFGSICTGAFILAAAGLLDGHIVTTHWAAHAALEKLYSNVRVQSEALYIQSENLWTSAGVASGIDMALAIVAVDHGTSVMNDVAKRLVIYAHRPGNQSQFSKLLENQRLGGGQFSDVLAWLDANLDQTIKVSDMAERAAMSERSFFRKFSSVVGTTPSRYLEQLRLYRAKSLIEEGLAIKQIYPAVGYSSEQGFRSAFEALFGVTPSIHRKMVSRSRKT